MHVSVCSHSKPQSIIKMIQENNLGQIYLNIICVGLKDETYISSFGIVFIPAVSEIQQSEKFYIIIPNWYSIQCYTICIPLTEGGNTFIYLMRLFLTRIMSYTIYEVI